MKNVKEMRERLGVMGRRIIEMAALPGMDAEAHRRFHELNDQYDEQREQIERVERAASVNQYLTSPIGTGGRPRPGREDYDSRDGPGESEDGEYGARSDQRLQGFAAWIRRQVGAPLTERMREAADGAGYDLTSPMLDFCLCRTRQARHLQRERRGNPIERRAMSAVNLAAGGALIPEAFMSSLETAMLDFSGVRQVAQIIRTDSGAEMPWPVVNDTDNEGEQIGENTQVGEQDIDTGAKIFSAYKFSSKLVKVPTELLEDSAFDLASEIGRLLGERIGRITNRRYTDGTGAAQPVGIVTGATLGVTTTSPGAITADELLDLAHSVDPSYRGSPSTGYMMHDSILQYVRKLKDGNGDYIFTDPREGGPARLWGYPVTVNQHMADTVTAEAKTVLFGQLDKYKVRDVRGVRLLRLVERYAELDQVGFIAFFRTDGNLLDAGTRPVKYLQQHA